MSHEERQWMRHLSGELPEADTAALRQAASQDPALAQQLERYDDLWQRLDGPPERPVEAAFSPRVVDAARRFQPPTSWRHAPAWVRLSAAACLLLGVTLGSAAGVQEAKAGSMQDPSGLEDLVFTAPGMADGYWALLDEPETWDAPSLPETAPNPRARP